MLLFRSFALGLIGACLLLLATRPTYELRIERPTAPWPAPMVSASNAAIVDVAPGVSAAQLTALVHLASDERVVAVGETRVASDLEAGAQIARREVRANTFVDLTVSSRAGERRVIILMH